MARLTLALVVFLATACSSTVGLTAFAGRSSGAHLSFDAGDTEASGQLVAFDPTRHSLDIGISISLEQAEDLDVYIVTSNGVRFQVLESFTGCEVDGSGRHCERWLPVLPDEGPDNWRVEAVRTEPDRPATVQVEVTWVSMES
ncbi:MAG TPA: hypothetical protein VLB85_06065 [Acidimicrobiia bacterium]|nr:hypothetical protein [Acidimicrobiia bacterium]